MNIYASNLEVWMLHEESTLLIRMSANLNNLTYMLLFKLCIQTFENNFF